MGDVSLEEPSNALEDWHEYLASMGPVNALFDRLGMDRSDIRVATQLNWSRRNLTDADCHVIADIFRANSAYTINPLVGMFSLNHNNVGDEGMVAIADALKLSNSLLAKCTDVWLNNNSIGDEGVCALADSLKAGAMPKLHKLYLNDNNIGDEGAGALADAIRCASQVLDRLRFVYLGNNKISTKGRAQIEAAVAKLGRITIEY